MRHVTLSDHLAASIDDDYVYIINDEDNEVVLNGEEFRQIMTVFVEQGGLTVTEKEKDL